MLSNWYQPLIVVEMKVQCSWYCTILREPRPALSRPELYSGHRSMRPAINSVGTYLDAKIGAYDAQLVFLHAHIERMTQKKKQLLAYQKQT